MLYGARALTLQPETRGRWDPYLATAWSAAAAGTTLHNPPFFCVCLCRLHGMFVIGWEDFASCSDHCV